MHYNFRLRVNWFLHTQEIIIPDNRKRIKYFLAEKEDFYDNSK